VAQTHTRLGYPMEQIIILAEEIRAGLIVMGSRGLGGIKCALTGSVSNSVVHHAHCPVLVVRAGENGQEVTLSSKRILLATDGSEEATVAGQAATEIAQKTDSELHLAHISHPLYELATLRKPM
jgi:nucleotide-binding universal stress UspA family protein